MHAPVPTLLLTRPKVASERFAAMMKSRIGDRVAICTSPLMEIHPTTNPVDLGDAKGLIVTSMHGALVASAATTRRDLPVFCVGRATCQAAMDAGWNAVVAGHNADSLIDGILALVPEGPLFHFRGSHSYGEVAARLSAAHMPTTDCIVYDQVLIDLSDEAKDLLLWEVPVIVPLFSQRSAAQFVRQAKGSAPLYFAAFSKAVAGELNAECLVAARPDALAMAEAIELLVNQVCRVEGDQTAQ
jgi:uroporphyrinogen-III synthase